MFSRKCVHGLRASESMRNSPPPGVDVVRSFFDGRASRVAAQLLESEDLTAEDLRAIRSLLDKRGGGR